MSPALSFSSMNRANRVYIREFKCTVMLCVLNNCPCCQNSINTVFKQQRGMIWLHFLEFPWIHQQCNIFDIFNTGVHKLCLVSATADTGWKPFNIRSKYQTRRPWNRLLKIRDSLKRYRIGASWSALSWSHDPYSIWTKCHFCYRQLTL